MKHTPPKLLQRLAEATRVRNYSYRTEQAYVMWVRQYIKFHKLKHPEDMGEAEVARFLNFLTIEKEVAPNTQNQALNALKFLYRHVLSRPLEDIEGIHRSKKQQKLPVVLEKNEIRALFKQLDPPYWLLTGLMYGSGLRLMEALRLRVKDLDFNYRAIYVRNGKGGKDRVVSVILLPLTCWSAAQILEPCRNNWDILMCVQHKFTRMSYKEVDALYRARCRRSSVLQINVSRFS